MPTRTPRRDEPDSASPDSAWPDGGLLDVPWLRDPEIAAVVAALTEPRLDDDGPAPTARFVGGCVRNALLGAGATDIDIAVDLAPDRVVPRLEAAGLKVIPTGVEHGTLTTLAGDEPIEVTSLRRDVETDGRRAVVAFTRDWTEDASRRDFTMNALYADPDGRVFDPLGRGLADLRARRLRFIGHAEDRIREDYLRILRYFRFLAWYGDARDLDPGDLAAVSNRTGGLSALARERVGQEMRKLFAAPSPAAAATLMDAAGALNAVLPGATASRLAALEAAERARGVAPSWPRRLLAAASDPRTETHLGARLRLSNAETADLARIQTAMALPPAEAAYRCGAAPARDGALIRAALGDPVAASDWAAIDAGAAAVFPLDAKRLIAAGVKPGPKLGELLKAAEQAWIDGGFTDDAETLLTAAVTTDA